MAKAKQTLQTHSTNASREFYLAAKIHNYPQIHKTFDNGKEFSKFAALSLIKTKLYFCKPASPWKKGQVERLNAQLHKYIPKKSDLNSATLDSVTTAQDILNNIPRKVLNFLTLNEAWLFILTSLLHFKSESSMYAFYTAISIAKTLYNMLSHKALAKLA